MWRLTQVRGVEGKTDVWTMVFSMMLEKNEASEKKREGTGEGGACSLSASPAVAGDQRTSFTVHESKKEV